jgi:hypothetical protein
VVFGEVADELEEAYERVKALGLPVVPGELADVAVYHHYPSLEAAEQQDPNAGCLLFVGGG